MKLYVATFILALLAVCPASSAWAARSAMSEQDQAAMMANVIEGMKEQLKQLESMYQSGEALRSLEQAEQNIRALEAQYANDPKMLQNFAKKREELRAAKAALQDPERLREIEKLREQIREMEAKLPGKPAPQADKPAFEAAGKTSLQADTSAPQAEKPAKPAKDFVATGTLGPYSAEMVEVKSGRVTQKLAVTRDKTYVEIFDPQGRLLARGIFRADQGKVYTFNELDKSYVEISFDPDDRDDEEEKREKTGAETVNGYKADKFRITGRHTGDNYEWLTAEFGPKPIRTEHKGVVEEMRNIRIGEPNASLFDIPAGYTNNAMMQEMMKNLEEKKK